MPLTWFRHWLKRSKDKQPKPRRNGWPRHRTRLVLEQLEDRIAPVAGMLDVTFGFEGVRRTDPPGEGELRAVDHQTNGDFVLLRVDGDGVLDPSFGHAGSGGIVRIDFSGFTDQAQELLVQADGKLIVTGFTFPPAIPSFHVDFALARFSANGVLDSTFGPSGNGKVTTDFANRGEFDFGLAADLDAQGRIVVVGRSNNELGLARYEGDAPVARPVIQFSSASYSVSENGGSATITVTRGGVLSETVFANFSTANGTAIAGTDVNDGADYVAASGVLSFGPNETSKTFTISIFNDTRPEGNETVQLTLSNPGGGGAILGPLSSAILTVVDDEIPSPIVLPNQQFVAEVYLELLRRGANPAEIAQWVGQLERGVSRSQVVLAILDSQEYQLTRVRELYQRLLRRTPTLAELNGWLPFLRQNGSRVALEALFYGSEEYFRVRGGNSINGYLTALYQDALNRPPDAGGATFFATFLVRGATRSQVAELVLRSTEATRFWVGRIYFANLDRLPDFSETNKLAGVLDGSTSINRELAERLALAEMLGTEEAGGVLGNRSLGRAVYILQLYLDLLHRPASVAEQLLWVSELERGVPRDEVVAAILFDPGNEFRRAAVNDVYLEILNRPATQAEIDAGVQIYLNGTIDHVRAHLFATAEFSPPSTPSIPREDEWLGKLIPAVFGRPLDRFNETDRSLSERRDDGETREAVALSALQMGEARALRQTKIYQQYLGQNPPPAAGTPVSNFGLPLPMPTDTDHFFDATFETVSDAFRDVGYREDFFIANLLGTDAYFML